MAAEESKKDADDEQTEEWDETSITFRFCQFVVNRNLLAFTIALLVQTSFPLITAALYFTNSDVLPIDFTDIPLLLFDEPSYRRAIAWNSRTRDLNEPIMLDPSFLNDSEVQQQLIYRQYTADVIELFYEIDPPSEEAQTQSSSPRGQSRDHGDRSNSQRSPNNILTAAYLRRIAKFERSLLRLPFYEKFCVLEKLDQCKPIDSIIQYFPFLTIDDEVSSDRVSTNGSASRNGSTPTTSGDRQETGNHDELIWWTIDRMKTDAQSRAILENYLGTNPQLDTVPPRSTKLRSLFRVSWVSYDVVPLRVMFDEDAGPSVVPSGVVKTSAGPLTTPYGPPGPSSTTTGPKSTTAGPTVPADEPPTPPHNTKAYAENVLSPAFWNHCMHGLPDDDSPASSSSVDRPAKIRFSYYNLFLYYDRLRYQCWEDETWAFGSFIFIFAFLWFQTRSLFLAIFGMYFILSNFVGGNLFYRYVFDFHYFGVFNALAIFLVLAVGVDEIFVFEESWSATGQRKYPNLAARLYDCYRKCSLSIFVPTLATTIALIQTALCPLMALSSFGTFAASVVVLNYLSIVTYFPCVLIFYHTRIDSTLKCHRRRRWPWRGGRGGNLKFAAVGDLKSTIGGKTGGESDGSNGTAKSAVDSNGNSIDGSANMASSETSQKTTPSVAGNSNPDERELSRADRLSQRACNAYCALLWKPSVQAACLILTATGLGFLIYSSTKLTIDKDPPKLYTESHPLGAALRRKTRDFATPEQHRESQFVQMHLIWGIKDWDRSMCHRNEWKSCMGKIVWDENFDLNPFPAQLDLLNICRRIRNLKRSEREELQIRTDPETDQVQMSCFMEDMDNFFHTELGALLYEEQQRAGGLPSTQVKVEALMLHVPQIFNMTKLLRNPFFYRYFEIANLYWLNDGYKFLFPKSPFTPHTFRKHALLLGHSLNISDLKTVRSGGHTFVYGTKLRYAAIVVNTTIPREGLRYDHGLETFNKWEHFFNDLKSSIQSPQLRQSGFVIAPDPTGDFRTGIWHWLVVQKVLITSAWQGILIGVGLALPILIVFTDDFLVGTLTTFTIACTSISIVGVIPLAGWKLGLLESLNLTLVADLAIDHIVHVAEGYQLSKKPTRKEKVEELLHEAGISIVSGALTTFGASVFLLFAKIVFFMQFGLFILFTVAFSVVYSLGMFVVLLTLIGPEDDRYSLSKWYRKVKRRFKSRALEYLMDKKRDGDGKLLESIECPIDEETSQKGTVEGATIVRRSGKSISADDSGSSKEIDGRTLRSNGKSTTSIDRVIKSSDQITNRSIKSPDQTVISPTDHVISTNQAKKSIDDDNISSGYESTAAAPNSSSDSSTTTTVVHHRNSAAKWRRGSKSGAAAAAVSFTPSTRKIFPSGTSSASEVQKV